MITTTLNRIRTYQPCADGWGKLLKNLSRVKRFKHLSVTEAGDEPLTFATILECAGLDAALWCCRVEPQYAREWRLYAVWCARQVSHLTTDQRSLNAIDVAEQYANGLVTDDELETAWNGALSAVWKSGIAAALSAADAVAWEAARESAKRAARESGEAAARDSAWGRPWYRTANAAWYAAWDCASDAAMAAQSREFLRVVTETEAIESNTPPDGKKEEVTE